ncbi:uncharacterized protein Dwil_GK27958 [Drosophila willistoni]|nr:uncharacterized protein Dwil_GK27958 [Drosophila willistoni]
MPTNPESRMVKEFQPQTLPVLRQRLYHETLAQTYAQERNQSYEPLMKDEFCIRRLMTMRNLTSYKKSLMPKEKFRAIGSFAHILVLDGVEEIPSGAALGHPFMQNADFQYLCNYSKPGGVLIILLTRKEQLKTYLFETLKDSSGYGYGDPEMFHVDEIYGIENLKEYLWHLVSEFNAELWFGNKSGYCYRVVQEVADELKWTVQCPHLVLLYCRSLKTDYEIECIKVANVIAAQSMQDLIKEHGVNWDDHKLKAFFDYQCRNRQGHRFDDQLRVDSTNGLWLMEACCQYANYWGSITRCWPINGRFSPPQKVLYEILVHLRNEICKMIQEMQYPALCSGRSPLDLQAAYAVLLAKYLKDSRVLSSNYLDEHTERQICCTPNVIRHIGLVPAEGNDKLLKFSLRPRNVLTLQLTIAIPDDCIHASPEYRGVICMLGDNLLIKDDYKVEFLTQECVSQCHEVETLRYNGLHGERNVLERNEA